MRVACSSLPPLASRQPAVPKFTEYGRSGGGRGDGGASTCGEAGAETESGDHQRHDWIAGSAQSPTDTAANCTGDCARTGRRIRRRGGEKDGRDCVAGEAEADCVADEIIRAGRAGVLEESKCN